MTVVFGDIGLRCSKCYDRKAETAFRTSKCCNRSGKEQKENPKCYSRLGKTAWTPYLRRLGFSRKSLQSTHKMELHNPRTIPTKATLNIAITILLAALLP